MFKFYSGDRVTFTYSGQDMEDHRAHSGQVVEVVERLDPTQYDFTEVGPLYTIKADDGWTAQAFEDELLN